MSRNDSWLRFGAALAVLIVLLVKWRDLFLPFYWDEMLVYAKPAYRLYRDGLLTVLPGLHEPKLFFGHIPGFSFLLALIFNVFGVEFAAARLVVLILTLGTAFYTYRLGNLFGGRWAGICSGISLFFLPTVFSHSTQIVGEMGVMCFGSAALFYACAGRTVAYAISGCLAILMKETGAAVVVPTFLITAAQYLKRNSVRRLLEIVLYASPVVVLGLFFLCERIFTGRVTNFPFLSTLVPDPVGVASRTMDNLAKNIWNFQNLRYVVIFALFGAVVFWRSRIRRREVVLVVSVSLCFVGGISLFNWINKRYFLPAFPGIFALAAGGVVVLGRRYGAIIATVAFVWMSVQKYGGAASSNGGGFENNMQYRDVVAVHSEAARYVEEKYKSKKICAAWPVDVELSDPFYGYVKQNLNVEKESKPPAQYEVVVLAEQSAEAQLASQKEQVALRRFVLDRTFERNGKRVEIWRKP